MITGKEWVRRKFLLAKSAGVEPKHNGPHSEQSSGS